MLLATQHSIVCKVTLQQRGLDIDTEPAQAFVYITAEFETPKNKVNQAVLWSRIVQTQKDAEIKETVRFGYPYQLTDPGEFHLGNTDIHRQQRVSLQQIWHA